MALPKLEGLIRLDAVTAIGTFGGAAVSVAAGEYYLGTFCDALAAAITAAIGSGTTTITVSDTTDAGTGKVTIARSANYTATWSSTTIRNILGFAGNLTTVGTSTFTGDYHAKHLWLPTCGRSGVMGPEASSTTSYGHPETDLSVSKSPSGYTRRMAYSTRYVESLEFRHIKGKRASRWVEEVTNESFQKFYEDVIGAGLPIRYYPDRSSTATYHTWVVEDGESCRMRPNVESWVGAESQWTVGPYRLAKLVA